MGNYDKNIIKSTREYRADRVAELRENHPMPEPGELWMCQVCEDLLGVGDSVTDLYTCDRCFRAIEVERVWVARWRG